MCSRCVESFPSSLYLPRSPVKYYIKYTTRIYHMHLPKWQNIWPTLFGVNPLLRTEHINVSFLFIRCGRIFLRSKFIYKINFPNFNHTSVSKAWRLIYTLLTGMYDNTGNIFRGHDSGFLRKVLASLWNWKQTFKAFLVPAWSWAHAMFLFFSVVCNSWYKQTLPLTFLTAIFL